MNLQLQGNIVTLIKCKIIVSSFIGKLKLFKQNLGRREFYQFPRLAEVELSDDDLLAYCEHLEVLKEDMIKRFTDLLELELPDWIIDPFSVDVAGQMRFHAKRVSPRPNAFRLDHECSHMIMGCLYVANCIEIGLIRVLT